MFTFRLNISALRRLLAKAWRRARSSRTFHRRLGIGIAGLLSLAFALSPIGALFESAVSRRFEFFLREQLSLGPELSPKLKIFVFDDQFVSRVGDIDVPLADWALMLQAISQQQPRAILIDRLFDARHFQGASDFVDRMSRVTAPVYAGAFVTPKAIAFRSELDGHILKRGTHAGEGNAAAGHVYGPRAELLPAFSGVGHLVYSGDGFVAPLLPIGDGLSLRHIALMAAKTIELDGSRLVVDGRSVPRDSSGRILVNVPARKTIAAKLIGAYQLLERARQGRPISIVKPDDVVLILPSLYTGGDDWLWTPAGTMPGGYVIASVVNNVLGGIWIRHVDWYAASAIAGSAFAVAAVLLCWRLGVMYLAFGAVTALPVLGIAFLLSIAIVVPWGCATLAALLTTTTLVAFLARDERDRKLIAEQELEAAGLVQQSFFRSSAIKSGALEVFGLFDPATRCSGDWWWHHVEEDIEYILIGDAMGHGAGAAFATSLAYATLQTILRSDERRESLKPERLLTIMNEVLFDALGQDLPMTMFAARIEVATGLIEFSNAGHIPPYLFTATSLESVQTHRLRPQQLILRGMPLGFNRTSAYSTKTQQLSPGDILVLFTDGIIEALPKMERQRNPIAKLVHDLHHLDVSAIADAIVTMARRNADPEAHPDDATAVVVRIPRELQTQKNGAA